MKGAGAAGQGPSDGGARARRRWVRPALFAAVVLAALAAGLALGPPGETALAGILRGRLERLTGGRVELAALDILPLAGAVEIRGLSIEGARAPLNSLNVQRLYVAPALGPLLRGELVPVVIEADGLHIKLRRDVDATFDGAGIDLAILRRLARIRVGDGRLETEQGSWPFDLTAEGIVANLDGALGEVEGGIATGPFELRLEGRPPIMADSVSARLVWNGERLLVPRLRVDGRGLGVSISASARWSGSQLRFSGGASVEAALDVLLDAGLQPKGEIHGRLSFDGGWPGAWRVEGRAETAGEISVLGQRFARGATELLANGDGVRLDGAWAETIAGSRLEGDAIRDPSGSVVVRSTLQGPVGEWSGKVGLPPQSAAGRLELKLESIFGRDKRATHRVWGRVRPPANAAAGALDGEISGELAGGDGEARFDGSWNGAQATASLRWTGAASGTDRAWDVEFQLRTAAAERGRMLLSRLWPLLAARGVEVPDGLRPVPHGPVGIAGRVGGEAATPRLIDVAAQLQRPAWQGHILDLFEIRARSSRGTGRDLRLSGRATDREGRGLNFGLELAPAGLGWRTDVAWRDLPLGVALAWIGKSAPGWILPGRTEGRAVGLWSPVAPLLSFDAEASASTSLGGELRAAARGRLGEEGAEINSARVLAGGLRARFAGDVVAGSSPGAAGDLVVDLDLSRLPQPLADRLGKLIEGRTLEGRVRAEGTITTAPAGAVPASDLRLSWQDVALDGRPIPDGQGSLLGPAGGPLDISLSDGPLSLRARIESGEGSSPEIDARLEWRELELMELAGMLAGFEPSVNVGIFSGGHLEIEGPATDPEGWSGDGELEQLEIFGPSYSATMRRPAALLLAPGLRLSLPEGGAAVLDGDPGGRIELSGSLDVAGDDSGRLSARLVGDADLSLLEILDPDLIATGTLSGGLVVAGRIDEPTFLGRVEVHDGRARLLTRAATAERIEGSVSFEGERLLVERLGFGLGGGEVSVSGRVDLDDWLPSFSDITIEARDVALSVPRGMWGRYDASLRLQGAVTAPVLRGRIGMLTGRYSREFEFLSPFAARQRIVEPVSPFTSWLSRAGLDVEITGDDTLTVRNEMATMAAGVRLRVGGTFSAPQMIGQVSLLEGGRLAFRDVDYDLVSGQLLLDDLGEQPLRLIMRAQTDLRGYRILLDLDATPDSLDYNLRSTPALSSRDILMLLLTGQAPGDSLGAGGADAANLARAYFGSQLGELLLAGPAKRWLGLSQLRVSPSQTGSSASPTARVTVGRRLNDRTYVLYSRDLSSDGRDVYQLERDVGTSLRLRLGKLDLGGLGLGLSWLARFDRNRRFVRPGAGRAPGRWHLAIGGLPDGVDAPSAPRLGLDRLRTPGRAAQLEARDALKRRLVAQGYIEARVSASSEGKSLTLEADAGPRWAVRFEGSPRLEKRLREALVDLWTETEFRTSALREAERVLYDRLAEEGRATAVVEIVAASPHELLVRTDAGPRVSVAAARVRGTRVIDEAEALAQILSRPAGGLTGGRRPLYRPRQVQEDADALRSLYERRGFLNASVEVRTTFHPSGSAVDLEFRVQEGEPVRVRQVQVIGGWPDHLGSATERLRMREGSIFLPQELADDRQALREALDAAGYYAAVVSSRARVSAGDTDVYHEISAGPHAIVSQVRYEGLNQTSRRLVQEKVRVSPGDPLSAGRLREIERELFRTGLFRDVEVTHEPAADDPGRREIVVRFRESPPFALRTELSYDTEEKLGANVTLSHDNVGGKGRRASLQGFASSRQEGLRLTFEQPRLRRDDLEGLLTVAVESERREGFTVSSTGFAVQVSSKPAGPRRWQAVYALRANRFSEVSLDPAALEQQLQAERGRLEPVRLGSLSWNWISDRRDDPFLPHSGRLLRSELALFDDLLGSEARFAKWQGQLALYRERGPIRLAGSLRLGVARGYGATQTIPLSERYFAGGSSTLRGFARDRVGPLDGPGGEPLGGEAQILLNLEARWRLWRELALTVFGDAGNVWLDLASADPGDLRSSAGLGVRYETPVGALRLEYGFKLDRREGESPGRFVLSIGEVF